MKKRNLVIVAFMLVAAMTIGVGYAALSATLTIGGTASFYVEEAEDAILEDVYFSAAEVDTTNSTGTHTTHDGAAVTDTACNDGELNGATMTFTVKTLERVGQQTTFLYTITNSNVAGVAADLAFQSTSQNSTHYGVTLCWADDGTTGTRVIEGNSTEQVKVVVTLNNLSDIGAVDGEISETFAFDINVTLPSTSTN